MADHNLHRQNVLDAMSGPELLHKTVKIVENKIHFKAAKKPLLEIHHCHHCLSSLHHAMHNAFPRWKSYMEEPTNKAWSLYCTTNSWRCSFCCFMAYLQKTCFKHKTFLLSLFQLSFPSGSLLVCLTSDMSTRLVGFQSIQGRKNVWNPVVQWASTYGFLAALTKMLLSQ